MMLGLCTTHLPVCVRYFTCAQARTLIRFLPQGKARRRKVSTMRATIVVQSATQCVTAATTSSTTSLPSSDWAGAWMVTWQEDDKDGPTGSRDKVRRRVVERELR